MIIKTNGLSYFVSQKYILALDNGKRTNGILQGKEILGATYKYVYCNGHDRINE